MKPYKNIRGKSIVKAYEIKEESITLKLKKDPPNNYLYSYLKPGKKHVERMKELAKKGSGLNSYIIKKINRNYETKW